MVPKVSVIIPFKTIDHEVEECIEHCLRMDYSNFELILLPDVPIRRKFPKSKVFVTGNVKPSLKRNIGIEKSGGTICAFIDSDAYPKKDWLDIAVKSLKGDVGAVGGPNLLPHKAGTMEKAGDDILKSPVAAGSFSDRYKKGKRKCVGELPTCNLVVKKDVMKMIGGFDASLLTAEDAKACFQIRKSGKKVLYVPELVVYHHRRKLFVPHLKQIWRYGRDKARLLGSGFMSSGSPLYFAPSLLVIFLLSGFAASFWSWWPAETIRMPYLILVGLYLIVALGASVVSSPKRFLLVFPGIVLTHITYGVGFIYGLVKRS